MCDVDVFDHLRFCDEFSHLVNSRLMQLKLSAEVSHRGNPCFGDLKQSSHRHIHSAAVKNLFFRFNYGVK